MKEEKKQCPECCWWYPLSEFKIEGHEFLTPKCKSCGATPQEDMFESYGSSQPEYGSDYGCN